MWLRKAQFFFDFFFFFGRCSLNGTIDFFYIVKQSGFHCVVPTHDTSRNTPFRMNFRVKIQREKRSALINIIHQAQRLIAANIRFGLQSMQNQSISKSKSIKTEMQSSAGVVCYIFM